MTRPPYDVYTLHVLKEENADLRERNIQLQQNVGAASTPVEQFFLSAKDLDDIIIDGINEINDIKREIIKISQDAFNTISGINAVGIVDTSQPNVLPFAATDYPGRLPDPDIDVQDHIGIGSDWYLAQVSQNTNSYNKYNFILTGTGTTGPFAFRGAVSAGATYIQCDGETPNPYEPPIDPPGQTAVICQDGETTTIVQHNINIKSPTTFAPVFPDHLRAWQFPELEKGFGASGRDPQQNNPTWPGEYQTISTQLGNTGIGLTSNLFFNGEYNGVFSAVPMGIFYDITGISTFPVHERTDPSNEIVNTFQSKISVLEAKIDDIRTYITDIADGVNPVKNQKFERQLGVWGLQFSFNENQIRIAQNEIAIRVIEAKTYTE